MKSRRGLLSSRVIDLAKSIFVRMVMGKLINPQLISVYIAIIGIFSTIIVTIVAVYIHPKSEIDKELNL